METVSITITDQNGDLVTAGVVSVADTTGRKISEVELGKKKPAFNLATGNYTFEIQSPGFKVYRKDFEVKNGFNNFDVELELEEVKVNIEVEQTEKEKRMEEAMGGFLSQKEIDALPETGEEIKEELKRRYGDDILIRIDGDFDGSQVPSRSEIFSIKVITNTFDAEFHEIGRTIIDIRTNITAKNFRGWISFNFNNSNLNARNPFDLKRQTAGSNFLLATLSGPLIKDKSSFNLAVVRFNRSISQRFIGTGFDEEIAPQKIGNSVFVTNLGIKYSLPKAHQLNFKYEITRTGINNAGLGAFDLPERSIDSNNTEQKFSLNESGTFKGKYVNDFAFEVRTETGEFLPESNETTILVLNAFNRGSGGVDSRTNRKKFRIADNLLFDAKEHSLKLGGEITFEKLQSVSANNLNGTFTFLNLTDFNNGNPSQFSQTIGQTEYELSQATVALYFQDYFKLNKSFQASLGVRYEWQSDLNDKNNFSPRIGYVWSPEKSGKFILRGGAGIFYDWLDTATKSAILSNDGRQGRKIIIINPSFPNPFNGDVSSQLLSSNISKLAGDLTTPYIFVAQNGFNYKLSKTLTFEGIYTFRRGLHHFRSRNTNAPVNDIRPNTNFGVIQLLESSGTTNESSFELRANGYFKGVNTYVNYQLGKKISDFSSALSLPADNYNLRLERGISNLDQPHKLNISFNFNVLKTITVSPSIRIESGYPYTITTGRDNNGDTVFNDRPFGLARNTERGEWLKQADLRISWKMPLKYLRIVKESNKKSIGLNINVRNLFNTSNLTNYVGIQTSPFFRQPSSARDARSIQFSLSYRF
ncbi:MAG: hypothetical protein ACR2L1_09360 [Pyrinomonadaceae bacterium]